MDDLSSVRGCAAVVVACMCFIPGGADAAKVRGYQAARHDRFTGFPVAPLWNDAAWFGSRTYAGVGWWVQNTKYQLALVTPEHFLCARHARPSVGATIRFLSGDGLLVERTVQSVTTIPGPNGESTDVSLARLSAAVGSGIDFFPYLNLAAESAYPGMELVVFGWDAKVGRGIFDSFQDDPINGLGETRLFKFFYWESLGNADDMYLEAGDSGSPSFALASGRPALVGMHAAVGSSPGRRIMYDTFIPHHVPGLNAVLDPLGYRMTPAYPLVVELSAGEEPATGVRRQGMPASLQLNLENLAATDAENVRLALSFPAGAVPDTLVPSAGWVVAGSTADGWNLRRGGIAAGQAAAVTVGWSALPEMASLKVTATHSSDGSPSRSGVFDLAPAPSYLVWSKDLADPGPVADPDGDGIPNLLEYAFGGDPAGGPPVHGGPEVLPVFALVGGLASLRFPVRKDAGLRGISYVPEFSDSLQEGSWVEIPAGEFAMGEAMMDTEFVLRTLSFPPAGPQRFYRLRVALNE